MYMNKTKRILILVGAILNLVSVTTNLILSIIMMTNRELQTLLVQSGYVYMLSFSTNLIYSIIGFVIGAVASTLLLYSIRQKGKYFRTSQMQFYIGLGIVIFFGSFVTWLLLFVATLMPDIIVMNTPREIRREEIKEDRAYSEKKRRIEELKALRDSGAITEEEYKEKLFELL